jgi:hypothetical protein
MSITVADVLNEVRVLTQFPNQSNIPDSTLLQYLNLWWGVSLPQGFTHFALKSEYSFMTTQGQPNYSFPISLYLNQTGGIFCDGIQVQLFQDANAFANQYNTNRTNSNQAVGNGTIGVYTGYLQSAPLIPGYTDALGNLHSQVFFTATSNVNTVLSVYDNGDGVLEGDGSGTINYATGAYTILFSLPVANGSVIYANYTYYSQGRPWTALFYQNIISLRAVPDRPYFISCNVYLIPQAFTSTNQPIPITQYFDIMARGTALRIATSLKDVQQTMFLQQMYDDSMKDVQNITTRQRGNQRPSSQFFKPTPYRAANQAWANNPAPVT